MELEWELYDIFDSGTFAFPIYDHNSARRIVRYLLMRGIIHEEIAEAIEDSTHDLNMWLNRHGKHKIGEWVIAWINDCREDFDRGEMHKMGEEGDFDQELFLRAGTPDSEDERRSDDEGGRRRAEEDRRSDSRITELDSLSSQAGTSRASAETLDKNRQEAPPSDNVCNQDMMCVGERQAVILHLGDLPPPPLSSRPQTSDLSTLTRSSRPGNLDLTQNNLDHDSSTEGLYEPPDSGHFSDLYTAIPSDNPLDPGDSSLNNNISPQCTAKLLSTLQGCQFHNADPDGHHSPSLKCTCSLAHYSYIRKKSTKTTKDVKLPDLPQTMTCNNIYTSTSMTRAMEFDLETLDRQGPGFIFIMTDSIANCLPWSSEHRYKIASSRQPDRYVLEFRTRNIDIDLIWQVKVKQHMKAVREIHSMLTAYNLHSNWFKCSLSLIMDTVSRVVKHYK